MLRIVTNFQLQPPFEDLERDIDHVLAAVTAQLGDFRARANFQVQVLTSLFFRNKGAYIIGKVINGLLGAALRPARSSRRPGQADDRRRAVRRRRPADAVQLRARPTSWSTWRSRRLRAVPALDDAQEAALRESTARSGCTSRARTCSTATSSITCAIRATSSGKRAGIKGMVMLVFDLPSFPFVFKVIKGLLPAAEGHHARADQEQVPAW
jgi:isocitrate dehydrogenase kinase/phosphatase